MSDFISKDVAIKELRKYADIKCANGYIDTANGILSAVSWIKYDVPTVDAEPVRHGRWEQIDVQPYFRKHYYNSDVCCSVCHVRGNLKYNYCPNCGAKMKKEK